MLRRIISLGATQHAEGCCVLMAQADRTHSTLRDAVWHPDDRGVRPHAAVAPECSRKGRARRGFTLLELILALSITMVVGMGLLAFHQYTVRARTHVLREVEQITAARTVMDRLTVELRAAVRGPGLPSALEGGRDYIQVLTSVLPDAEAWQSDSLGRTVATTDLRFVRYGLGSMPTGLGESRYGLRRTERTHNRAETVESGRDERTMHVTDQIGFLRFRYFDGASWSSTWYGGGLPRGVEVTIGALPLPEEMEPEEYPYPYFRRLIAMTGASRVPVEAAEELFGTTDGEEEAP